MKNLYLSKHDNVVEVLGCFVEESNVSGIVMKYMCKGDLSSLLCNKGVRLSASLRCRMCHEIASGIAHLHTLQKFNRLVHGDLKLENILLCNELRCKISDFGTARIAPYSEHRRNTTKKHSSSETLQRTNLYAAPEILNDPLNNTEKRRHHDVYSYSVIATELIGWERPSSQSQYEQCIEEAKNGQRPDFQKITFVKEILQNRDGSSNGMIINELIDVIEQCRKHEPSQRCSISEAREMLDKCWTKCDKNQISQDVKEIINKLPKTILSASKDDYSLVPLNQLSPNPFSPHSKSGAA